MKAIKSLAIIYLLVMVFIVGATASIGAEEPFLSTSTGGFRPAGCEIIAEDNRE